jgi:L,D-transpeptidase ErfK/SrfK
VPQNKRKLYIVSRLKSRNAIAAVGVLGSLILVLLAGFIGLWLQRSDDTPELAIPSEIAGMDLNTVHKQAASLTSQIKKLEEKENRLFPSGPAILVDSAANHIYLIKGSSIAAQDKCSTGSGLELTDTNGLRTWTFDTPRGYFRALSKVTNPVWYRPDWAFIEEGEPIPKDRESRAVADVLGDYAIAFGDGYFIHGTLYTRMLGTSVTHGCIRVDDDTLKKIYETAQPGTPIYIF